MFSWSIAILVFFIYFALDAVWVYYTLQMTKLNAVRASISAVVIYGLSSSGVLFYIQNSAYVLFVLLGAFLGTFVVVEYEKRKTKWQSQK